MKIRSMVLAIVLAAAPAAAQPEPSASEVAAVRELLEVSRSRESFIRAMELGMEQGGMGETTPQTRKLKDGLGDLLGDRRTLRALMDEHFRYEDVEPEMIRMYADLYTEEEIRGMTAFYRTPLGQRMVETRPELSAASQRIAQRRLQAAMPQLLERMRGTMQQRERSGTTPKN